MPAVDQAQAFIDVRLHSGELVVGQFGRLVEDGLGNARLADIVQQAAERQFLDHFLGLFHGPAKGDEQRRHAHRMLEVVVVEVLQAGQRQQGILMPEDRFDHAVDQRLDPLHADRLPEPHIVEHHTGQLVGLAVQAPGACRFVLELDDNRLFGLFLGDFLQPAFEVGIDLGLGSPGEHVGTLEGIDVQLADAEIDDLVAGRLILDVKRVGYEGMI